MIRRELVVLSLGLTVAFTACHKKAPPVTQPTPSTDVAPPPPPPAVMTNTEAPPPPAATDNGSAEDRMSARVATMSDRVHFEYNKSDIMPDDQARLDAKAALMKQFADVHIRITGNCDERGSDQYNIALGMRRATAAKDYLVRAGIDASRIEVASLGREVPIDPAHTDAAWALNRRDEFAIIAGSQSLRSE
jgi:peptidoglycan-associated lipoprotein